LVLTAADELQHVKIDVRWVRVKVKM
jgi:hypothetical protein